MLLIVAISKQLNAFIPMNIYSNNISKRKKRK